MFSFTDRFDRLTSGPMTLQIIEKVPALQTRRYFLKIDLLGYRGLLGIRGRRRSRVVLRGGHGYAQAACRMVLPVARYHGMTSLYLTCAEGNIASRRTIEHLGAEPGPGCPGGPGWSGTCRPCRTCACPGRQRRSPPRTCAYSGSP